MIVSRRAKLLKRPYFSFKPIKRSLFNHYLVSWFWVCELKKPLQKLETDDLLQFQNVLFDVVCRFGILNNSFLNSLSLRYQPS